MAPALPDPSFVGRVDGLAYAVFSPVDDRALPGGVVCLHGADSRRSAAYDTAALVATRGLTTICFDQRGHGDSDGRLGAGALDDVATVASLLPPGPVGLRGSSMGGCFALAAAARLGAAAVVAMCPATPEGLRRGVRERRFAFRADAGELEALLANMDLTACARALGPRLLLIHAENDESVPVEHSHHLHRAAPGSHLTIQPGGHHRSIQHDPTLLDLTATFLRTTLKAR